MHVSSRNLLQTIKNLRVRTFRTFLARVEQQNYADHDQALAALERQGLTVFKPICRRGGCVAAAAATRAANAWVESDILVREHVETARKKPCLVIVSQLLDRLAVILRWAGNFPSGRTVLDHVV